MPRKLPPRYRRRKNGVIYVTIIFPDGSRPEESTHSKDVDIALAWGKRRQLEATDPDHALAQKHTLSDAIAVYAKEIAAAVKAGAMSEATQRYYLGKLGHVMRVNESTLGLGETCADCERERTICTAHYAPMLLCKLREPTYDYYIGRRRDEGASDTTIKKELGPWTWGVMRRAKRNRWWYGDIDTLIPASFSPAYEPVERWLPPHEFFALLAELSADRQAQVAFIVASSAEASALVRALDTDIPEPIDHVVVRGSKNANRRDRKVPVFIPWQRDLLAFARERAAGVGGKLFLPWSNDGRDLHAACERAKIAPCSFNDLRRTFAHWMRASGVLLEHLAPMMGHADTKMLQRVYAKLNDDELAAVMQAQRAGPVPRTERTQAETMNNGDGNLTDIAGQMARPEGFEPSTLGFVVLTQKLPPPREDERSKAGRASRAAPVPHKKAAVRVSLRIVKSGGRRERGGRRP